MAPGRARLRLVLDFDGTITTDDTTAVIGARCISKAGELAGADVKQSELPKSMQHYSEQYMQDYRAWQKKAQESRRSTVEEEISYLSQSRSVEQNSYLRVKNAVLDVPGVREKLEGDETARNEFMTAAGREAIRSGEVSIRDPHALRDLITIAEREGNLWGIVSVSWSRRFILGALVEAGVVKEDQAERSIPKIKCNEILAPDQQDREGNISIICSARDKLNTLHELLAEWDGLENSQERQDPAASSANKPVITIYIGDSSTDIGCLAGPAIGMYILRGGRENDSVVQSLERLGIECLQLSDLPTSNARSNLLDMRSGDQNAKTSLPIVCLVEGFQEVNQWVDGLCRVSSSEL